MSREIHAKNFTHPFENYSLFFTTIILTILFQGGTKNLMISLFFGVFYIKNTVLQRSTMSIENNIGQSGTPAECYVPIHFV